MEEILNRYQVGTPDCHPLLQNLADNTISEHNLDLIEAMIGWLQCLRGIVRLEQGGSTHAN